MLEKEDSVVFTQRISALLERIDVVFPKSDPPEPEAIAIGVSPDCLELVDDFAGVQWWMADPELVFDNFAQMAFMTPVAFHYYLPAYLKHALNDFDPFNPVMEFTLYTLGSSQNRKRKRLFTEAQREVINEFLSIVRDHPDMEIHHPDAIQGLEHWSNENT